MSTLTPGEVVDGRYRLERLLGSGGFGEVWEATQLSVGRKLALKLLHPDGDGDLRRRFQREAEMLARLSHPHCVGLFDSGTWGGRCFIAMELIEGVTLDEWLATRRSPTQLLEVAQQICAALAAAHSDGIVHRDLKPANVMVTEQGALHVTVVDFGIAKLFDDRRGDVTETGEVIGTAGFMSPEQLRGQRDIGPATDLYALGALLYLMFAGHPAYDGDSPFDVAMKQLTEPPPRLQPPAPPNVRNLVADLLQAEPARRGTVERALNQLDRSAGERGRGSIRNDDSRSGQSLGLVILSVSAIAVSLVLFAVFVASDSPKPVERPVLDDQRGSSLFKAPAEDTTPGELEVADRTERPDAADHDQLTAAAGCRDLPDKKPGVTTISRPADLARLAVRIPHGYDRSRRYPVVLALHDGGQSADGFLRALDPSIPQLDQFIVVAPEDRVVIDTWEEPHQIARAWEWVRDTEEQLCVDLSRLYVIGHGSGGPVAVEAGRGRPSVRAVAASAYRKPTASRSIIRKAPVPYLFISVDDDPLAPADGGKNCLGARRVSIDVHESKIRQTLNCPAKAAGRTEHPDGVCTQWSCDTTFVSCRVSGGRPWTRGRLQLPQVAKIAGCASEPSKRFPYTKIVFEFFSDVDAERGGRDE